jgi:long-subunit fatty acid transport protein
MIKKIITSAFLILSFVSFAQEGTASPYSFFGIGDVRYKGTSDIRSMAGIAVEQDSIHINMDNPASYANLKNTTFAVGGTYNTTKLKTSSESASARRTTLDYLAVGLPLGKFGLGFGLLPYSSVGYKIESLATDASQNNNRFNGTGGLSKVFLGLGYKITPSLSFGADAHYNFGKIETSSLEFITGVPVGTRELNKVDLSGVNFDAGLMYQTKINKKLSFFSSLNYTLESTLSSTNKRSISTVMYNASYDLSLVDAIDDVTIQKDLKLPSKLTIGVGIGEARKWLIGAQVSMRDAGSLAISYNNLDNVSYEKQQKYSLGGYYIPNYKSYTSYAKRIVYRGGFRYEKTGLVVNSESINDMGITLGIGMPITGSFSNINFGFEIGKKGTTTSGLVQENYANLSVGMSLNDKWFVKRKFN